MFEKIVLRSTPDKPGLTIGTIAEAMLYYEHVHIILDWGTVSALLNAVSASTLLRIIRRKPQVSAVYCDEILGVFSSGGATPEFELIGMHLSGVPGRKITSSKDRFTILFERHGYDRKDVARYVTAFRE